MNVAKWGPDGWCMLHYITVQKQKSRAYDFFKHLQFILPCIYCRISYGEYFKNLPYDDKDPVKWLYSIHNMVNNKLRKQNIKKNSNPSYKESYKYIKNLKDDESIGDTFLSCICFNFPCRSDDKEIENKRKVYKTFFKLLAKIHPNKTFRDNLRKNYISDEYLYNRSALFKWYHKNSVVRMSYKKRYSEIKKYQAKCSNNTCRKKVSS